MMTFYDELCEECREEADWLYQCEECWKRLCEPCYGDITLTVCKRCSKKEEGKTGEQASQGG